MSSTGPPRKSKKRVRVLPTLYEHRRTTVNETVETSSDYLYRRRPRTREVEIPANGIPSSSADQFDSEAFEDPDLLEPTPVELEVGGVTVLTKQATKRYDSSDQPLKIFLPFRNAYLDAMLFCEGRGMYIGKDTCSMCEVRSPSIRCKDCFGEEIICEECAVKTHGRLPLHRIERWDGSSFGRTTLQSLGLVVQLGHCYGQNCANAQDEDLTVIDTNGIHSVSARFCGCQFGLERFEQLLRLRWYPATPLEPKTVFTFNLLRQFQYQNLRGNITAYDFYQALEFLTDGRLSAAAPNRAHAFSVSIREWRHLKALKRAGRGHDPSGVDGTQEGELAVTCRACPTPGINLPAGWEDVVKTISFLYWSFHAQDANFRLKGRYRDTKVLDVTLSPGWAYFVEDVAYKTYISRFANQEEISTCSGFAAIHLANLKKMRGLHATGVAGTACARHEMWKPNGMGDLQKGERYCNMDYVLLSSLRHMGAFLLFLVLSYDIACQYFKRFFERVTGVPENIRPLFQASQVRPMIPKAHLVGHGEACHGPYSSNYCPGCGRTDGECIERLWAVLNKAAPSVHEMTRAGRRETIDDFCGFANWMKTLYLADFLLRRMLDALKQAEECKTEFESFDHDLRLDSPDSVAQWEAEVELYLLDHSKPCPYLIRNDSMTMKETVAAIKAQEEDDRRKGRDASDGSDSPSTFILVGLDLEEKQRTLRSEVSLRPDHKLNALELAARSDRRANLRKKIDTFQKLQAIHMPGVARIIEQTAEREDIIQPHAEEVLLYLPSHIPSSVRSQVCDARLIGTEDTLREAQAHEALEDLRRELRARVFANKFKIKNVTGQRANTRARTWQKTIDEKAIAYKHTYRAARAALVALRPPGGEWEEVLMPLTDQDVRAFNERAMTQQEINEREEAKRKSGLIQEDIDAMPYEAGGVFLGDGSQRASWIWRKMGATTVGLNGQSPSAQAAIHDALKVMWARSKARADRWTEEVALLWEEMRRCVVTTRHIEQQWRRRADQRPTASQALREGLAAYALAQANAERRLADVWEAKFHAVRTQALKFLETTRLCGVSALAAAQPSFLPPSPPSPMSSFSEPEEPAIGVVNLSTNDSAESNSDSLIHSFVELSLDQTITEEEEWD